MLRAIMRSTLAVCIFSVSAQADPLEPIKLWSHGVPSEADLKLPKESREIRGDSTEIMSNVSIPTLTMYPAPAGNNKGTTVLVCPGGGYNILAYSHEGSDVCKWLNEKGINAGLLKYRVPRRHKDDDAKKHVAPLQDVQRAMTMIRANADKWKLNRKKVGILGFSAGGHLSAMALTSDGKRTYSAESAPDESEGISCIPDFGILVYPAYLGDKDDPVALSPELKVTETTPATFLIVAHDDRKYVEGSPRFYIQMLKKNRPCELHIFAKGGHGFGMRKSGNRVANWPQLALDWMGVVGFVE